MNMKRRIAAVVFTLALCLARMTGAVGAEAPETDAGSTEEPVNVLPSNGVLAPSAFAKTGDGTMYVADCEHHVIWLRGRDGSYTRAAGSRDVSGFVDGAAETALFHSPWDIVSYRGGYAISDTENHAVRLLKDGTVETLAGGGQEAYRNGAGKDAAFSRPTGLAVGADGELYIADTGNHVIRVLDKKGNVKLYAGSTAGCADGKLKKAMFEEPTGLYYSGRTLYVADSGNHRICMIKNGRVTTIAGSAEGIEGNQNGASGNSRLSFPQDIFVYKGVVYIADTGNGYVKKLKNGKVTNVIRPYTLQNGLLPVAPRGLTVKSGYLFVGDIYAQQLIKIKL